MAGVISLMVVISVEDPKIDISNTSGTRDIISYILQNYNVWYNNKDLPSIGAKTDEEGQRETDKYTNKQADRRKRAKKKRKDIARKLSYKLFCLNAQRCMKNTELNTMLDKKGGITNGIRDEMSEYADK